MKAISINNATIERVKYLDCVRALSMLWVVGFYHLKGYFAKPYTDFLRGVD